MPPSPSRTSAAEPFNVAPVKTGAHWPEPNAPAPRLPQSNAGRAAMNLFTCKVIGRKTARIMLEKMQREPQFSVNSSLEWALSRRPAPCCGRRYCVSSLRRCGTGAVSQGDRPPSWSDPAGRGRKTGSHLCGTCFSFEHVLIAKPVPTFAEHVFRLSMFLSQNRFPLLRNMLYSAIQPAFASLARKSAGIGVFFKFSSTNTIIASMLKQCRRPAFAETP